MYDSGMIIDFLLLRDLARPEDFLFNLAVAVGHNPPHMNCTKVTE